MSKWHCGCGDILVTHNQIVGHRCLYYPVGIGWSLGWERKDDE